MSYAVQHNLPIFHKNQVTPSDGKFYINAIVGFESYLGVMNTSPRKDYFASIDVGGQLKIGRLDSVDVMKKIKKDSIFVEVIPNRYGTIDDFTEFIPKMKAGYLVFSTIDIELTFFDWLRFLK